MGDGFLSVERQPLQAGDCPLTTKAPEAAARLLDPHPRSAICHKKAVIGIKLDTSCQTFVLQCAVHGFTPTACNRGANFVDLMPFGPLARVWPLGVFHAAMQMQDHRETSTLSTARTQIACLAKAGPDQEAPSTPPQALSHCSTLSRLGTPPACTTLPLMTTPGVLMTP